MHIFNGLNFLAKQLMTTIYVVVILMFFAAGIFLFEVRGFTMLENVVKVTLSEY